ncbi:MAG: hypothetical protein ACKVX7_01810 [Planctomycetota bacterium]
MSWNKEKAVFAASIVLLVLVVVTTAKSWLAGRESAVPELSEPRPAGDLKLRTTVDLAWFKVAVADIPLRNPYQAQSDWQAAQPDPLRQPPLGPLARRVPVPATLAAARGARPLREATPPANRDEATEESAPSKGAPK